MNYVEQTESELNRKNRINPANVPIPVGGPAKLAAITPEQLDAMIENLKMTGWATSPPIPVTYCDAYDTEISLRFTRDGPARVEPTAPLPQTIFPSLREFETMFDSMMSIKPGGATHAPAVDYQALAAFRADVIEELQREIAALKLDRDAKMDAARGLRDMAREKAPTKGEVLANALARCDSVTTAYGR